MNCEDFSNVVLDIAREQIQDVRVRAAAMDHVGSCDHCRIRLQEQRDLSKQLHALAVAMTPLSAAPQIHPRVIATLRSPSNILTLRKKTRRHKTWAAAAAAILLVAIGLTLQLRNALLTPEISAVDLPPIAEIQVFVPESVPKVSSGLPLKLSPNSVRRRSRMIPGYSRTLGSSNSSSTRSALPATGNAKNEFATDFFAIGDTSASSLADGGQLVRVELPRSALMSFGLPVNMNRANGKVKADVLVGSDGIARAIRFVE